MHDELALARTRANYTRYQPGQGAGHYESFFQRANHPTRPLAFWIRYTLFSPDGRPQDAIGEIWAISFDGETGHHVVVKREVPFARCHFDRSQFAVSVDDARLGPGRLTGAAASLGASIAWDLSFRGDATPLFLLPLRMYAASLPRAKSLVALPSAVYSGALTVNGRTIDVADWVGSQNHNWGRRHTDQYAWGQVAGFDDHPESFLEVATARLKIGPCWTPAMTPLVLRHRGRELAANGVGQTLRAKATVEYFHWIFSCEVDDVRLEGRIEAPRDAFVGLRYSNPPGGTKHCLNSKLAACELTLTRQGAAASECLVTRNRAAFEILIDDVSHGVPLRV